MTAELAETLHRKYPLLTRDDWREFVDALVRNETSDSQIGTPGNDWEFRAAIHTKYGHLQDEAWVQTAAELAAACRAAAARLTDFAEGVEHTSMQHGCWCNVPGGAPPTERRQ